MTTRRALPQQYESRPWTELFNFAEAGMVWTPSGSAVVDHEAVHPVTGETCVSISGFAKNETFGEFTFAPSTPFSIDDIKAHPIRINVYAKHAGNSFTMTFGMTGLGDAKVKAYTFSTDQVGAGYSGLLTHYDLPEDPFNATRKWSGSAPDTSLTVDKFNIYMLGTVPEGQIIYFSTVEYGGRARPKVMFGIDNHSNGFGNVQETMLPDMQALNWPGYMAWSSNLNPWNGETDLADTLAMVNDDGWIICNHSIDHIAADVLDSDYAAEGFATPEEYAVQQYTDNAAYQVAEGFPASHLYKYSAQPQNKISDSLKSALDGMGYVYSRAIAPAFISGTTSEYNGNWTGTFSIGQGEVADPQDVIDYALLGAVLMGCSINFFTHGIHATESLYANPTDWDYFIAQVTKYRNEGKIDLVSVHEWYKGLTYPRRLIDTRVSV